MHISLHSNHIFNSFLLLLDIVELASVPLMDTVSIALDIVGGSRSHVIKDAAISVLGEFLIKPQVLLVINLLIFEVMHVLHKLVPSLHVFNSFISLLFLFL